MRKCDKLVKKMSETCDKTSQTNVKKTQTWN